MEGLSLFTTNKKPTASERSELVDFLFKQLGKYGDPREDIAKCLEFALQESPNAIGGFAITYRNNQDQLAGAVIVNQTGMSKYIPENILVYIAVHESTRGQGIGKKILEKVLETAKGNIALHVEPDNPAVNLYKRMGFTNKYLEMRYER